MGRITEEISKSGGWRGFPVTIGLLVAIIGAALAVIQAMSSISERSERAITKAIDQHDQAVGAHKHIQQAGEGCCNELRGRVRNLEGQLQEVGRKRRGRR